MLQLVFRSVKRAYTSRHIYKVCFLVDEGEAECITCREHMASSAAWKDIHV